jgi:hypothetical protein
MVYFEDLRLGRGGLGGLNNYYFVSGRGKREEKINFYA